MHGGEVDGVEFQCLMTMQQKGRFAIWLSRLGVTDDYIVVVPGAMVVKEWPLLILVNYVFAFVKDGRWSLQVP